MKSNFLKKTGLFRVGLLAAVVLIAMLGACKKRLPAGAQNAAATTDTATDTVWDGSDYIPEPGARLKLWYDIEESAEAIVEEWGKVYADIPLEYEIVSNLDARPKMVLDGPAGLGADVFVQPHDGLYTAYSDGVMLPMARYGERISAEFNEQAAKVSLIEGEQYAIPWTIENIALFYNKDLYKDEAPQSWEQITDFAAEYNDPQQNKWAIRWEVNNSYINYFFLTAYGFRLFGEKSADADNPGWGSAEVLEGLRFFQSLQAVFDVGADDASGEYTVAECAKGTVPFTITGPWSIGDYKEAGINFGVAPIPLLPGGRRPYTFSGAQLIVASSYTEYPNAARRLAMFLTEDAVLKRLHEIEGKLPARKDLSQIPSLQNDPYQKGILEQAPYSYPMPSIPEMSFAWEPQRLLFYYTWNGELTPQQAVEKALQDYEAQRTAAAQ